MPPNDRRTKPEESAEAEAYAASSGLPYNLRATALKVNPPEKAMSGGVRCPYCGGTEGGRCNSSSCSSSSGGRSVTECVSCGRVVEERLTQIQEVFVERAQDSPLCIVTPDFSDSQCDRPPPMEDDPFESIGFITAFSTWSLELAPVFTATTTSFCGHLAELERVLLDSYSPPDGANSSNNNNSNSLSLVDNLRAYLQIVDVSSILGLDRDISDHAIQLFRDCSSAIYLRNRNIEALATAALVQAIREAQEPRTLQEISAAANVQQKEIGKYIKILGDALKLSQPINSNSIAVHMPRFCSLLQLNKATQDLATHIGEVVIDKCFCTRRNPISISAAAIYLSCQLEDKRKTQAEICKATGLTEVTLRKVYKELLENWNDLLPSNYTPAVPPEKAFPMTAVALGRASATRADVNSGCFNVTSTLDSSVTVTSGFSSATVLPDVTHGVGSGSSNSTLQSFGQVSGSLTPEYAISSSNLKASTPSLDGKGTGHLFVAPSVTHGGNTDSEKRMGKNTEDSHRNYIQDIEQGREQVDPGLNTLGGLNFMSQFSTGMPNFQPSFLPVGSSIDPRVFREINPTILHSKPLYGVPEGKGGQSSNIKGEDALQSIVKGYSFLLPNLGDVAISNPMRNSSSAPDFHQAVGNGSKSENDQQNDIKIDREKVYSKEDGCQREDSGARNQVLLQYLRGSPVVPFNTFGAGTALSSSTATQSFPSNIFSFLNPTGSGSLGIVPPQMLSSYGALRQAHPQPVEMHAGTEKGSHSAHADKHSHGIAPTAGVGEALSRLASTNIAAGISLGQSKGGQASTSQSLHSMWSHPFHQSSFPTSNGGNHVYGSSSDGLTSLRRDVAEENVISGTEHPRLSGEGTNLNWPSSDGQGNNNGLNLSFGADHGTG